jgi:predicted P-loop ATPase
LMAYVKHGFPVFPLGGTQGKEPLVTAWNFVKPDPTMTPTKMRAHNFGVALRDTDLVVDLDPRNFPKGDNPAVRLLKDIGKTIKTHSVKTGGGGRHLYFRKPASVKIRKNVKEYPGIDFLSKGAYVVGSGSIHGGTGVMYEVVNGTLGAIMDAPEELLYLITKTDDKPLEQGLGHYDDGPGTIDIFRIRLETTDPAVQGEGGDIATYRAACVARDLGLSPAKAAEVLLTDWNINCMPPWEPDELREKVRNAYAYGRNAVGSRNAKAEFTPIEAIPADGQMPGQEGATGADGGATVSWRMSQNGIAKCLNNAIAYLTRTGTGIEGLFGYNEFTGTVEYRRVPPWKQWRELPENAAVTDSDMVRLRAWLATMKAFEIPPQLIQDAVTEAAHRAPFHPVRDWLDGLLWDGKPRIDTWLTKYAGVEQSQYSAAIGRKFLCGAAARIYRPGCKFDTMPVLEGHQGIGKTRLCKALGGKWYGDIVIDPHSRDTVGALLGKWIVEMSEMEVTKRAETTALKAFISRQSDRVRLAYGRLSQDYPRQCVFIGSINPETDGAYLKDSTGNRRFWPVAIPGKVDVGGVERVREQLFAEAVDAVNHGETLYLDSPVLELAAKREAAKRAIVHPWVEAIGNWLTQVDENNMLRKDVTAREVFIGALEGNDMKFSRQMALEIGKVLQQLGWESGWGRRGNSNLRVFKPVEFKIEG